MREQTSREQGLTSSLIEHDACGVGFVANIRGEASHAIVENGIEVLKRLEHRGACGCDPETGDGAGILIQIPDTPSARARGRARHRAAGRRAPTAWHGLPPAGSRRPRKRAIDAIEEACAPRAVRSLGWRDVPGRSSTPSPGSATSAPWPTARGRTSPSSSSLPETTRRPGRVRAALYVIRTPRRAAVAPQGGDLAYHFYVCSFSSRTIVYKGMLVLAAARRVLPRPARPACARARWRSCTQRFSTNTFPTWDLAHPFRFIATTARSTRCAATSTGCTRARALFESPLFGDDIEQAPARSSTPAASDSATFDNALELLVHTGRSLPHAMMMLIPEAWQKHETHDATSKKAFYEYHACLMEPWDGPASIAFTDGRVHRRGARPQRPAPVALHGDQGRLRRHGLRGRRARHRARERRRARAACSPGRMFLVDLERGRIVADEEIKRRLAARQPYGEWLERATWSRSTTCPSRRACDRHVDADDARAPAAGVRLHARGPADAARADGRERRRSRSARWATTRRWPCCRDQPQLLFNYFKQLFAQVTNPPIDAIREELVMSLEHDHRRRAATCSTRRPSTATSCELEQPILTNERAREDQASSTRHGSAAGRSPIAVPGAAAASAGLAAALDRICARGRRRRSPTASTILILSDRGVDRGHGADPVAARRRRRAPPPDPRAARARVPASCVESGEPREVHPLRAADRLRRGRGQPVPGVRDARRACAEAGDLHGRRRRRGRSSTYIKAIDKGLLKVMSKMGISTLQSYRGAQIFEAVGLDQRRRSTATSPGPPSRIERHRPRRDRRGSAHAPRTRAYRQDVAATTASSTPGGQYQWRRARRVPPVQPGDDRQAAAGGALGQATRRSRSTRELVNDAEPAAVHAARPARVQAGRDADPARGGRAGQRDRQALHDRRDVASARSRARRTRTLAIAMNRIGGKSNTGEGGEDPARFTPRRRTATRAAARSSRSPRAASA